ncbi:hypothetical protein ABZ484_09285 [Streptomyces sp. NPDC006393]|uniref:hypothetical protein n=1 Tax=Streptomyces sp. NPDC006393 TaxID=3156763 RepID=UPI0033F01792
MNDQGRSAPFLPVLSGQSAYTLLGIYLNDHLAGATMGAERARHLATACRGSELGAAVAPIATAIGEDRRSLLAVMRRLELPVRRYKVYAGRLGERAGRLKSNGSLLRRSPLSSLLELELLQIGVQGKICAWETLRALADHERRLDPLQLDGLLERARDQLRTIDDLRARQAAETFRGP